MFTKLISKLPRKYRYLIHTLVFLYIFLIPSFYQDGSDVPEALMVSWLVILILEMFFLVICSKINKDYNGFNEKAIKKIKKMDLEKKKKTRLRIENIFDEMKLPSAGIRLKQNEELLYRGEIDAVYDPQVMKAYLQTDKLETGEEKEICPGLIYLTTNRMIVECAKYGFKLRYDEIYRIQYYKKSLLIYGKDTIHEIEAKGIKDIIYVFNMINQLDAAKN